MFFKFIQLLHEYRSKKVNSSHLELEELFNPLKLYNYLRNHHWKDGIPSVFIKDWTEICLSQYKLDESDYSDFSFIFNKLTLKHPSLHTPESIATLPHALLCYLNSDLKVRNIGIIDSIEISRDSNTFMQLLEKWMNPY